MCRFLAWSGVPRFLDELVLDQKQSLVEQSKNALIGKTPINADGFGVAWYGARKTPCLYKDTHPAWADRNLKQLAHHTQSHLFFAHVRASTGMATSHNNCHPFSVKKWCFMHNGQAGGHEKFRQALDAMIPSDLYQFRYGATESEAIFLIAMGYGLKHDPVGAMAQAVHDVQKLAAEKGQRPHMRFAACWSDGKRLFAARMASDRFAPSLYYKHCETGVIISSEPLDDSASSWIEIAPETAVEIKENVIKKHQFKPNETKSQAIKESA